MAYIGSDVRLTAEVLGGYSYVVRLNKNLVGKIPPTIFPQRP